MSIPFTQFLMPFGRRTQTTVDMPEEIEKLAKDFIKAGGWFESEMLSSGHVSLTACWNVDGEDEDIAIEVVENGPRVIGAVERLVRKAAQFAIDQTTY